MNNLKQQIEERSEVSDLLIGVRCLTIDTDLNVIYCVNRDNQLVSIDVNNNSLRKCCDISVNDVNDSYEAICVQFLSEETSVCIAFTTGHMVRFNTLTDTTETVGSLSDGLQSVVFSLDQELIALLTQNNCLILMNKLFNVLAQRDLKTDELGSNQSVSVNWGSKSTQFHGEGQRDVRTKQENFKSFSDFDDRKSRISWRADGLYFVTSYYDPKTDYRKLQIWSRDAVLQYTSEYMSGLEHLISWKPSGALIASSQLSPNKHLIVFIEKNGLKHREFELPFTANTLRIDSILWSNDSRILLVLGTERVEQISKQVLMLWRQTNYKWDLKQRFEFTDNLIMTAIWDPIDATLLHIVLSNGQYVKYRWKWSVDVSEGMVALIDGKRLKLTHFERSVIPPPLFTYSFDFESQIFEICFSKNKFALILVNQMIYLFENSSKTERNVKNGYEFGITYENIEENEEIFNCFYANKCKDILNLKNLVLNQNDILFGVDSNQLFCFDYRKESQNISKVLDINCNVLAINCLDDTIGIVANDGQLWKVNTNDRTISEWIDRNDKNVIYPQRCSRLELFKIENKMFSICLSENFSLYLNNEVLAQNNCNSFIKFKDRFLLFATTDHLLHCWPINDHIFDTNNNYQNMMSRSVERGSTIIAVTDDGKVVLQMPRGNLEAIYPRTLLLDSIKSLLDRLAFDLAFDLLRKHRINLNFIYDYKPNNFCNNIELFIEQIGRRSVDWICLFLTDLSNEDFNEKLCKTDTQKMSEFWLTKRAENMNKMDLVCDSMRAAMEKLDPNRYLHPILLTYVKKSVSETDKALMRIKAIDDTVIRDKAIKFLLYSININTLMDDAFGTYDSDIFLMIASKSQKDPKEYLALLAELNKIESIDYKCFKIDFYLKRYKKALTHISKCEEHFEECLELIRTHSLYRDSVQLFEKSSTEKRNRVWKQYAEYLLNKKYFEESAIAFKRSNDFVNAVKAYQLSANWSAAIDSALQCSHLVNIETLARNLAKQLASNGKHFEASYLLEVYAKDLNQSIRTLIDGHEWEHAVRLMRQSAPEEHKEYFNSELIKHFESIIDLITTNYDILSKHMIRLDTVRQNQTKRLQELKTYENFDDKSDIYSETSSLSDSNTSSQRSTSSSLATKKSRKSNKKFEKKKYVMKEGSVDEDIQLIYAINELIKTIDRIQEEVSLLIKTLFNCYYLEESMKTQKEFKVLLDFCNKIIKEIWTQNESQTQSEESTQKYKISDPELMKAPELRKTDWMLALV